MVVDAATVMLLLILYRSKHKKRGARSLDGLSYSSYRVAFVFRWLNECMERLYYVDPAHGGRHVPDEAEAARRKKHKRNGSTWTH